LGSWRNNSEHIMGVSVNNYIRAKMAARFALDFQDMIVLGNTGSADAGIKAFNGIIKQIETIATGVYDLSSSSLSISDEVLWYMWYRLATKYRNDKGNLRIYCNDNGISNYKQWFGKRETSMGDATVINGQEVVRFNGIRFYDVTSMPDGYLLLTNHNNIKPGVWLNVQPYVFEFPPAGYTLYGLNMRADVKIIEDDCAVLLEGLNTTGMTTA
jgi:hypothetical protein